jgi:hypothetical protein
MKAEDEPITREKAREHVKGWEKERTFKKGDPHDKETVDDRLEGEED